MTLEEKNIVKELFNLNVSDNGTRSCLTMALKSARLHTGRNIFSGVDERNLFNDFIAENDLLHSEYFTGLSIYLILLEQIGCVFKKKDYQENDITNGIKIALENFTAQTIDIEQIEAIKGLRNTLTHNFSLTSDKYENKKKPINKKRYKFTLNFDDDQQLIKFNLKWNGVYDKSDENNTIIGVKKLCELVENVYSNLNYEFQNGNIELRIKEINEIKARFTII